MTRPWFGAAAVVLVGVATELYPGPTTPAEPKASGGAPSAALSEAANHRESKCHNGKPVGSGLSLLTLKSTLRCHSGPCQKQIDNPVTGAEAFGVPTGVAPLDTGGTSGPGLLAEQVAETSVARCHWYSPGRLFLPLALVSLLAGVFLALQLRWATRPAEPQELEEAVEYASALSLAEASEHHVTAEIARAIGCYFAALDSVVFTMVIPDSYDIVLSLGGNAILSGAMIGAHKLGTACGAVVFYCALRVFPDIWRTQARSTLLVCALCNIIGTALYAIIAAASDYHDLRADAFLSHILLVFLFVGRIIGGVGSGIRLMIVRTHIARLTPRARRPCEQSRFLFAITLGMGLGPLLAAVVKTLDGCRRGSHQHFLPTGIAGLTLSLCQVAAAWQIRPVTDVPDLLDREESGPAASLSRVEADRRRCLIFCGLAFSVVRGLCLSGVEAASAMLLEVRFGWHPFFIGLTIGLAFLTCIPWRMCFLRFRNDLPLSQWIQLLLAMSMLGSLLLFRLPISASKLGMSKNLERGVFAGVLLVGDALLFPCFFLSDSLVQGLILQHPLPAETSLLNLNGVNLMNTVLLDGFARVLGPALSRFHVSEHGQNAYAAQQLILTLVAGAIAMQGFLPKLRQLEDEHRHKPGACRAVSGHKSPVPGG